MELQAFVTALANAAPSLADLRKCGLTAQQASEFRESYVCLKRVRPLSDPAGTDQMLELLRGWDLTRVQIGLVRFPNEPAECPGGISVGLVDADPLRVLHDGGEVVVHEFGTKSHLLWRVSKNGAMLLEALLVAAQFLAKTGVDKISFNDCNAAMPTALECAIAAGGDRYLDFYRMLLGAE
jgi:hypothetical protein